RRRGAGVDRGGGGGSHVRHAPRLEGRDHLGRRGLLRRDRLHDRPSHDRQRHRQRVRLMTTDTVPGEWGRRQLVIMLAAVTAFVALVVGGLGYVVVTAITTGHDKQAPAAASTRDWPVRSDGTRGNG